MTAWGPQIVQVKGVQRNKVTPPGFYRPPLGGLLSKSLLLHSCHLPASILFAVQQLQWPLNNLILHLITPQWHPQLSASKPHRGPTKSWQWLTSPTDLEAVVSLSSSSTVHPPRLRASFLFSNTPGRLLALGSLPCCSLCLPIPTYQLL